MDDPRLGSITYARFSGSRSDMIIPVLHSELSSTQWESSSFEAIYEIPENVIIQGSLFASIRTKDEQLLTNVFSTLEPAGNVMWNAPVTSTRIGSNIDITTPSQTISMAASWIDDQRYQSVWYPALCIWETSDGKWYGPASGQIINWEDSPTIDPSISITNIPSFSGFGYYISLPQEEGSGSGISFDCPNSAYWNQIGEYFRTGATDWEPSDDPYEEGGTSGTGGGTGTFDGTGDSVDFPSLPTLAATDSGFVTLFNPTMAQMSSLRAYMWDTLDIDNWKRIMSDPMECILGLSIVPVAVPSVLTKEVKVGANSTGINMNVASTQYIVVDCGSLNVEEYWGAYLDYSPYTKFEIYLPFIGTKQLSADDIMGKTVQIKYYVDLFSGSCIAYVKCGNSVLYSFPGQCAEQIPITSSNYNSALMSAVSIGIGVATIAATAGTGSAAAAAGVATTAANVSNMKPTIEKSGSLSSAVGMMGIKTPYLIVTRPRQCLPAKQNTFTGYPSYQNKSLGGLTGYTTVEEIHLEYVTATQAEKDEIISLLRGGVIL